MDEDKSAIAEQKAWQQIIGKKIICSECNNRAPECFRFSLTKRGPKSFVQVRCTECSHEGDYNPTDEEVYQYEYIARANIDKQVLDMYGLNPPISNVKVESVYREGRETLEDGNYAVDV
jgi:hypothetical protein